MAAMARLLSTAAAAILLVAAPLTAPGNPGDGHGKGPGPDRLAARTAARPRLRARHGCRTPGPAGRVGHRHVLGAAAARPADSRRVARGGRPGAAGRRRYRPTDCADRQHRTGTGAGRPRR